MLNLFNKTSYTFEGKKESEKVVLFLHRHWFTLVQKILILLILSVVPIVLLILLGQIILEYKLIPLFTFLWAGYLMTLWYYLFYVLTMYTLDYWIITNERLVNNTQQGFFNRKISELSIHMIQDVSVKLIGLIPTTMNFGSVEVQTAAEEKHFLLEDVPNPQVVKDKIMEIIEETEDALVPRVRNLTQRRHFHPDKQNTVYENVDMTNNTDITLDNQNISNVETRDSQLNIDQDSNTHQNYIPPNLPL